MVLDREIPHVGLDMGTYAIKGVLTDGERTFRVTVPTAGQPVTGARTCLDMLVKEAGYAQQDVIRVGVTGANADVLAQRWKLVPVIDIEALAKGIARAGLAAEAVLSLGHENMYYLELEEDQRLSFFNRNGQCAAGSGAFWYQQATRMGFSAEELSELAVSADSAARISGRCAVFAKSDMTHAINEGATQKAVSAGLARVLAEMIVNSITQNRILSAATVLAVGGVANNRAVLRYLKELCSEHPVRILVPEHHEYLTALGAIESGQIVKQSTLVLEEKERQYQPEEPLPALQPERVTYMQHPEVPNDELDASTIYVGVDCGSVSTKCVLLDGQGRFMGGVYLPTSGRPVLQVLELMKRIRAEYGDRIGQSPMVGCTTGSGRFLSQRVLNAEYAVDEITCQAEGVAQLCGEDGVLSIIEIGGEDSKFLSLQDGVLSDYNMNPVCAAGTGTFLENLAGILGVSIKQEFSRLAFEGDYAVDLGDRCTLLSQSALAEAASEGLPLSSQLASLAYASARNYLSRTTEYRPLEGKVVFTGATAHNHALAAAFAQELDKQVYVPPMPELTGALGSAIMARKLHLSGEPALYNMRSLDHLNEYTQTQRKCSARCEHGHNCTLDVMRFSDGTTFLYGDRCGRFSEIEKGRAVAGHDLPDYVSVRNEIFEENDQLRPVAGGPRVGIARAGSFYDLYPFWSAFFSQLGAQVLVTEPTSPQTLDEGKACLDAEMCYPVEVIIGHYRELVDMPVDYIFLPEVVDMPSLPWSRDWPRNFTCSLLQTIKGTVMSSVNLDENKVLYAELRYHNDDRSVLAEQWRAVAQRLLGDEFTQQALFDAVEAGVRAQTQFKAALEAASVQMMEVLAKIDDLTTVAVFLGRAYTIYDNEVSKRSLDYARQRGLLAIPQEFLLSYVEGWYQGRIETDIMGPRQEFMDAFAEFFGRMDHIYPAQLQRMLSAAFVVDYLNRRNETHRFPLMHTVLQDPFRCGPNAMLRHYLGTVNNSLRLTMDEHTAPAGMITRLEAFRNTCRGRDRYQAPVTRSSRPLYLSDLGQRRLLIPSVVPQADIFTAVFQNFGVHAETLPRSTDYDFTLARRYVNGEECLPLIQNVQDYLEYAKENGSEDDYLFFQGWACGPCRYGLYAPTQSLILNRAGCGEGRICSVRFEDAVSQFGLTFVVIAYDGMLAADVLQKMLLASRPYEANPGDSQRLFDESILELTGFLKTFRPGLVSVLRGSHLNPLEAILRRAASRFAALRRRPEKRPKILLAGEFYVRLDERSNQHVIRKVEAAGGEVSLSPPSELMAYSTIIMEQEAQRALRDNPRLGQWINRRGMGAMNWLARRDEHRIEHATDNIFAVDHEPRPEEVQQLSLPYVSPHYGGEPPMTIGRTCAMARRGIIDGVIFVAPFGCMPGAVVEAQVNVLRERLGVPFINLYYDGQKSANTDEFIAGLVFQARQRVLGVS